LPVDVIYTSALVRAQMTAMLAMLSHQGGKVPCIVHEGEVKGTIPVYCREALNERMYGQLQGLNKQETREKFGAEQVHIWRRSFDQAPPGGESLEMTAARAIPYFQQEILPHLKGGRSVLVAAHGNSLRAIVMFLDRLSKEEVVQLEIATGESIVYTFEGEQWERST
jgi:2,3-bisphosphoglycerate-dependent phosphoglycerate mutase